MGSEPSRAETAIQPLQQNQATIPGSPDPERVIQVCSELLGSGRPLSEILAETRRLLELGKPSGYEISAVPDAIGPRTDLTTQAAISTQVNQPTGPLSTRTDNLQVRFVLNSPFDVPYRDVVPHPAPELSLMRPRSSLWLNRSVGLSIIALICFAGIAGAGTAIFRYLPTDAQATIAVSVSTEDSAARPLPDAPLATGAERVPAGDNSRENGYATSRLSEETSAALLARGDELVSRADWTAGRLYYERAFATGNAKAALRLGATYDPSFLSRAGVPGARTDVAAAVYWYSRARDLGAGEAEALLKNILTK
jgi:hypothetical protein